MRKILLRLDELERHMDSFLASFPIFSRSVLGIIVLGIMLNLLVLGLGLWLLLNSDIKSVRTKYKILQNTNGLFLIPQGMQNAEKLKHLAHIFEIRREVGMEPIASSVVPLRIISLFVPFFRGFGADQCASSEGFLVTFTPRSLFSLGLEVIFCDYPYSWEEYSDHRFILFEIIERNPTVGSMHEIPVPSGWSTGITQYLYPGGDAGFIASTDRSGAPIEPRKLNHRFEFLQRNLVHHNLMMTKPLEFGFPGILVALNPTDEGRIGTGRNTEEKYDEKDTPEIG